MIRNLWHRKGYIDTLGQDDDPDIGQIFITELDHRTELITVDNTCGLPNCNGCWFNDNNIDCGLAPKCIDSLRKDNKSVIFKKYD